MPSWKDELALAAAAAALLCSCVRLLWDRFCKIEEEGSNWRFPLTDDGSFKSRLIRSVFLLCVVLSSSFLGVLVSPRTLCWPCAVATFGLLPQRASCIEAGAIEFEHLHAHTPLLTSYQVRTYSKHDLGTPDFANEAGTARFTSCRGSQAAAAAGALPFQSAQNLDLPHFPPGGRHRRHLAPDVRLACISSWKKKFDKLAWVLFAALCAQGGSRSACRQSASSCEITRPSLENIRKYGSLCTFSPSITSALE